MGTAGARLHEDLQPRMRYGSKKPLEDQQIGERLAGVKAANAPLVEHIDLRQKPSPPTAGELIVFDLDQIRGQGRCPIC